MKKKILVFVSIIILASVCCFNLLFALEPDPNPTPDDGGIGGGSGQLWYRNDEKCPDDKREKTICTAGGWQQCESRYCD